MNRALTIFLLVMAVAAVIFLAIYIPLTSGGTVGDRIMDLDPAQVKKITIVTTGETIELKRKGTSWQIGPQMKDRADNRLVNTILALASDLQFVDRIKAGEFDDRDDLRTYGVRSSKRRIQFDDGLALIFGKEAAAEGFVYARRDKSNDVYIVPDDLARMAFRQSSDFRDRRLTDLTADQIDRLLFRTEAGEMELVREPGGWRISKPLNALADEVAVKAFLDRLLGIPIQGFVADDAGDLGVYGIHEGQREIVLYAEGGTRPLVLRFGATSPENPSVVQAQFTARDSIYHLPKDTLALLDVHPTMFRDRRLLALNPDIVDLVQVKTSSGEFQLQRKDSGWVLNEGGHSVAASNAALQHLFDALTRTKVETYENGVVPGDAAPFLSLEFFSVLSENKPESSVGRQSIAGISFYRQGERVLARVAGLPGEAVVPSAILASLPEDPSLWKAPVAE